MNSENYYHQRVAKTLKFIIQSDKKVLFLGQSNQTFIRDYPNLKFIEKVENLRSTEKYDVIVLNGVLNKSSDIMGMLKKITSNCHPQTRIIVYQHNHLWQWILTWAENMGLKRKEGKQNWLAVGDTKVYLSGAGFEATRVFTRTLSPVFVFGIGPLINFLGVALPFFDFLKLDQYILARPLPDLFDHKKLESLTVCITVRNEKDNIEGIIKVLPKVCENQEILFVEGHSSDGTREEIEKMAKKYPSKNIRVMGQPGKGQGDAIRVGFKEAKGDIVILYEGDGTSDGGDLIYFYEAMKEGKFEFIEGSRFVYPLDRKAMPLANMLGNIFFAKWFSFFLGQRTTDVLSGIKGILKRDYDLVYERWGFLGLQDPFGDFELLYGAARMGLRIGEIPMRYYPRVYGSSKSDVLGHGLYLLRMAAKGYWIFRSN